MKLDVGMNNNLHQCVHWSNTNPEYSWKVDLTQFYDIEQLTINETAFREYKQFCNTISKN